MRIVVIYAGFPVYLRRFILIEEVDGYSDSVAGIGRVGCRYLHGVASRGVIVQRGFREQLAGRFADCKGVDIAAAQGVSVGVRGLERFAYVSACWRVPGDASGDASGRKLRCAVGCRLSPYAVARHRLQALAGAFPVGVFGASFSSVTVMVTASVPMLGGLASSWASTVT